MNDKNKVKLFEKVSIDQNVNIDLSKRMIMAGKVLINNEINTNSNYLVKENDFIIIKSSKKYVSRAAQKLIDGFNYFDQYLKNSNYLISSALDIGSSTGGFTQILLEKGFNKIYSLDSGYNQLDYSLRINPKVVSLEKTNLKSITKDMFSEKISFVVCDVSFISLKEVFKVLNFLDCNTFLVILIKPQFEANSNQILKGGIAPVSIHEEIINKVKKYDEKNFVLVDIKPTTIQGKKSGNIEYISLFKKISKNN